MITHEEVFTSPFPSPSHRRGRPRFNPDYEYSPPSMRKQQQHATPTPMTGGGGKGGGYRRSGPIAANVTPVPAPSFAATTTTAAAVAVSPTTAEHHRILERASRLNVPMQAPPYTLSANSSSSTVKAPTTFTNATRTTKQTTPPDASPDNHGRSSRRRRRTAAAVGGITTTTTERVIEDEDFRRLQQSLESLQKTLKQTRSLLRESEKNSEWWKERVKVLDKRSRGLEVDNRAMASRIKELEEENRILREKQQQAEDEKAKAELEEEERESQQAVLKENTTAAAVVVAYAEDGKENATIAVAAASGAATEKEKDKVYMNTIRSLIAQYWNMQTNLAVGAAGADTACGCAVARTVRDILLSSGSLPSNHGGDATMDANVPDKEVEMIYGDGQQNPEPTVRIPPHPHPEIFSRLRRVRKKALRKRVKEMKSYIEALRGENEVLEQVIHERGGDIPVDFDITTL